jgi:hypothetical protein
VVVASLNVTATYDSLYTWDIDISVDAAASPGFYEGFLNISVSNMVAGLMPVCVRVDGVVPGGTGSLTWGGSDGHPYDNGAIGGSVNYGDDWETVGDWRFYYVDVSHQEYFFENDSTMWVMTNVTWTDPDTVIEVVVFMTGYGNNAYFTWPFSATESELGFNSPVDSTWPGQNVLITDWCWDEYSDWAWNSTGMELWAGPDNSTWSAAHRGFLGIALHTNHWGSSEALDDLTITVTPILNSTLNHGR